MGNLTDNFSRSEFLCQCGCGLADPHPMLVAGLQELCDLARNTREVRPVFTITSGCRCQKHNHESGGAESSRHLPQANGYCEAADGRLEGWTLANTLGLAEQVARFRNGGIGVYLDERGPRIHVDVRPSGPARWGWLFGAYVPITEVLAAEREGHTNDRLAQTDELGARLRTDGGGDLARG